MAFGFPGGFTNTYLPALMDNLHVTFSRNAKDFAVNMVARPRPVKKPTGYYDYHNPLDYQRFPNGSTNPLDTMKWADMNLRPSEGANLSFEMRPFNCVRYSKSVNLSWEADRVADFPYVQSESENIAAIMMASRSIEVFTLITTAGSYPSTHVATATSWGGGFFSVGTETNPIIKKALLNIQRLISLDSNGNIQEGDLVLIVNPTTAYQMAVSQEVHSLFVRSQTNKDLLTEQSGLGSNAASFGLPKQLYGYRVVVADTSVNYSNFAASGEARSFIFPDNTAAVVRVKKSGGDATEGTSLDTVQLFLYEDMTIEAKEDSFNRLIQLAVTDNRQAVQVSGVTGALITNVLS